MTVTEAIYSRRAIKNYEPAYVVPEETITKLFEAALQSPTSFNLQHWRFVRVTDPKLRQEIRAAAFDQAQVSEASVLIVLTADTQAWKKNPEKLWVNAPEQVQEWILGFNQQFHDGQDQLQRDEAMRSIGIVLQTMSLMAKELGLDSGPLIGYDPVKVAELINLPPDHVLGPLFVLGKALKEPWPKPGSHTLEDVVITDRFPD